MNAQDSKPDSLPLAFLGISAARVAIIAAITILILGCFVACHCPGMFIVSAVCALIALAAGSRRQRIIAAGLIIISVAVAILEFRAESELERMFQERRRRISDTKPGTEDPDTPKKSNKPEMATPMDASD